MACFALISNIGRELLRRSFWSESMTNLLVCLVLSQSGFFYFCFSCDANACPKPSSLSRSSRTFDQPDAVCHVGVGEGGRRSVLIGCLWLVFACGRHAVVEVFALFNLARPHPHLSNVNLIHDVRSWKRPINSPRWFCWRLGDACHCCQF